MDKPVEYTLHFFPFSLYSLIARLGLVLGSALDPETAPHVELKLVNLHREENLSESYLIQVNSKGQVPSLTSTSLPSALTDSHDILNWLSEQQPVLIPEEHREAIDRLMGKFYAFHVQALMLKPEDRKYGIPNQAAAQLERSDISEEHRRALEKKSIFHDTTKSGILDEESIAKVKELAADFGADLGQVYEEQGKTGPWLFGERPTIVDAPATAFIARLFDIKQEDLIPETARVYGRATMATPEWEKTTHGRGTRWDPSMGHVADLQPL